MVNESLILAHRQAVAEVNLINDAHMIGVGRVELGCGHPLVRHEEAARLQYAEDLAIHALELRMERGQGRSCQKKGYVNPGWSRQAARRSWVATQGEVEYAMITPTTDQLCLCR